MPETEDAGVGAVLTIRPARPADIPALAALAARTWIDAIGDGVSPETAAAELAGGRSQAYFTEALRARTVLVAERSGVLVGYVQSGAVTIAGVKADPADRGLQRLHVETALQGRGLGRRLLKAALAQPELAAAPRVLLQVWEENERAVGLYESVGCRRAGVTRLRSIHG